jgi:hypothetical protein
MVAAHPREEEFNPEKLLTALWQDIEVPKQKLQEN